MEGEVFEWDCDKCGHENEIPNEGFAPPDNATCAGCGVVVELCLDGDTVGGFFWRVDGYLTPADDSG